MPIKKYSVYEGARRLLLVRLDRSLTFFQTSETMTCSRTLRNTDLVTGLFSLD